MPHSLGTFKPSICAASCMAFASRLPQRMCRAYSRTSEFVFPHPHYQSCGQSHSVHIRSSRALLVQETKADPIVLPRQEENPKTFARKGSWELTVGIEIHAQLSTDSKLFSSELPELHDNQASAYAEQKLRQHSAMMSIPISLILTSLYQEANRYSARIRTLRDGDNL